ncbi:MAG TPA: CDP-alcohol phosphatidyltransferase family protein [Candidatus Deferrimicrobium sp.]|nr:CDP-alcohol phosphatidyltransferase family protein [Candidatus Deferrimicrobium sp.]
MPKEADVPSGRLYEPANLLSLFRIAVIPFIGYYLWRGDRHNAIICAALLAAAGLTDLLDGWVARRMNQVSRLGLVLDPVADKTLALSLVVMLVFFRDLPLWLAGSIVGRDILILSGGIALVRNKRVVLSSNLTGKYTFVAIVFLLVSYVLRFEYGIRLMMPLVVALIVLSTILYARTFVLVTKGNAAPEFADRSAYRLLRVAASTVIAVLYFVRLYVFLFEDLL